LSIADRAVLREARKRAAIEESDLFIEKMKDMDEIETYISSFQQKYSKLKKKFSGGPDERQDHIAVLQALAFSLKNLCSISEVNFKKYPSAQNSAGHRQMVELLLNILNDLRLLQGNNRQLERLSELLKQGFTTAAQNLVDGSALLKKQLQESTESTKVKKAVESKIEEFIKQQGLALNELYKMMDSQMAETFNPNGTKGK